MDLQKEREAFEVVTNIYHCVYNTDLNYYFSGSKFVGDKAEIEVNAGWKAWQAAKAQAIPDGFVLVPKEPTQELLNKMQDFFVGAFENGLTGGQSIHCAYIAMIEAAQEPAND